MGLDIWISQVRIICKVWIWIGFSLVFIGRRLFMDGLNNFRDSTFGFTGKDKYVRFGFGLVSHRYLLASVFHGWINNFRDSTFGFTGKDNT